MSTVRPTVTVTSTGTGSTPKAGLLGGFLDANAYATKKTIAQGMLDVALLTANASQLKYLLQVGTQHEFYHLMMTLISVSIILQIAVGILFIAIGYLNVNEVKDQKSANILNNTITLVVGVAMLFMGSYNLNLRKDMGKADKVNNWTTVVIFIIVALNVVISAFGMAEWSDFPGWTPKNCDKLERFNAKCIEIRTLNMTTFD